MTNSKIDFSRLGPAQGGHLLVIGGCGGIGSALVAAAVETKLNVVVMDLPQSIEAANLSSDVSAIAVDLREEASITAAFQALDELDLELQHVVFASGYTADLTPVKSVEADGLDDIMNGNLRGQVFAARECVRRIADGSLVFVSTGIAQVGAPGYVAYGMAKAGINALTRILAAEAAPKIRVNGVAPGAIDTPFVRGGMGRGVEAGNINDDSGPVRFDLEAYESRVPQGRIGVANDIAGPILFLMSDAARYITGQVLHVNGGAFMRD